MISLWSMSDNKSSQIFRTPLSILSDINNAVVSIVSTCPLISKSSSPFISPSEIVPSASLITGITVTFIFHYCFIVLRVFHTSVSCCECFSLEFEWWQISRIFLSIRDDLNNAGVSSCNLISKSSNLLINPSEIVPGAPNTIGITVTFRFHRYYYYYYYYYLGRELLSCKLPSRIRT